MIIKDINIANFGKLSDTRLTPCRGLNVIYAPNESGKTSLMSFVKYIFYGTKQKKLRDDLSFKERYTPWSGLPMGGSIELEHNGESYIISRSEQGAQGALSVFNLSKGAREDNIKAPGIYFMGMGERAFSDSAYIADVHSIRHASDDGELLSLILNNDSNKKTYTRIKNELSERYLQITSPKRKSSALSQIDSDINDNKTALALCEKRIGELEAKISDNENIAGRINILSDEQNKLKSLRSYSELVRLSSDLGNAPASDNAPEPVSLYLGFGLALVSVLAIVLAPLTLVTLSVFGVSLLLSLMFFFVYYKNRLIKKTRREEQRLYNETLARHEKQLEIIKNELNMPIDEIKSFTNRDIDGIIKNNEDEINSLSIELKLIEGCSAELGELYAQRELIASELKRLGDKRARYLAKAEIISLASDILSSAFDEMRDDVFPHICKRTLDIYSSVTGSRFELASADESFDISLVGEGAVRSSLYFSKGSMDILYFSLRLAVIESLSDGGGCIPVFMDDIFANCDDARASRLLDMISELSEKNQIFLMTCRGREGEYFQGNDKVKIFNGFERMM